MCLLCCEEAHRTRSTWAGRGGFIADGLRLSYIGAAEQFLIYRFGDGDGGGGEKKNNN